MVTESPLSGLGVVNDAKSDTVTSVLSCCSRSYVSRRYQAPVTDTPRATSLVTPRLYSMSNGRFRFGSGRLVAMMPRFLLLGGPISLSWAMPSPLVRTRRPEHVDDPGR